MQWMSIYIWLDFIMSMWLKNYELFDVITDITSLKSSWYCSFNLIHILTHICLGWYTDLYTFFIFSEFLTLCRPKVHLVKAIFFSSSHVWIWELHYKESWGLKNWCFWTVVLEKTLESPLDCKEIQPVHPKGNQSWIFIERTDAEAETPVLWPPDEKNWLIWKDPDAGKDWGQVEKGTTEDEMVGWHHWSPGVGDGQGGLACCGSWGHKESDTTE